MKSDLIKTLNAIEHPILELESHGGSILVLPDSGRVLGLFDRNNENFYWVNPDLTDNTKAKALFSSAGWKNSGGDRTWVAPEIELFLKNVDNEQDMVYEVPSSIDPGNYMIQEQNDEKIVLSNQAKIILHRLKKECEILITKEIRLIPNPLRYDDDTENLFGSLGYIGYEQVTILKFVSPLDPEIQIGIWNLMQVPAGGLAIIPTLRQSYPRDYFSETGPDHLSVSPKSIQFVMDAKAQHKIGVKATSVLGRMGYIRSIDTTSESLVVRNFTVNPSGQYIDVPWDCPDEFGYAIQCYNDDGNLGDFGELEYHSPAIGGDTGNTTYEDRSQVWAFLGCVELVDEVAQRLLGVDIK